MRAPYRAPREHEDSVSVAEDELVLEGDAQQRNKATIRMALGSIFVTTAVCTVLANAHLVVPAVLVASAAAAFVGWRARAIRLARRIVVRIDREALVLDRGEQVDSIPLRTLDDVELETREIRRVGHDANPIPGLSFNQIVGPAVDLARVALAVRRKGPLLLSDEWTSHIDASETFRRLRLFLRAHGWRPRSERKKLTTES